MGGALAQCKHPMKTSEAIARLKKRGNAAMKKIYISHGAREPYFGVTMGDIKALARRIKTDHALGLELYKTGISDAMILAGHIVDPAKFTVALLDEWVAAATWNMLTDRCVAVVAAKSPFGFQVARTWVRSRKEMTACTGYATYACLFMALKGRDTDPAETRALIKSIADTIHKQGPHLQNAMNNCLIIAGINIKALHADALKAAAKVGKIKPLVADNSCNVQTAVDYLKRYAPRE